MNIYFVTDYLTGNYNNIVLKLIDEIQAASSSDTHFVTHNESDADAFLFTTTGLELSDYDLIKNHYFTHKYPSKCFLWCDKDIPYPILPGLYASMPKVWFYSKFFKTIFYTSQTNPYIYEYSQNVQNPPVLASFQGSLSSPIRKKIVEYYKDNAHIVVNTSNPAWEHFIFGKGFVKNDSDFLVSYAQIMAQSKFILCPKGNGVSSYRFFETLEAGRVPVIISDNFVLPYIDTEWTNACICIKENKYKNIFNILKNYENYKQMGLNAREIYLKNFHPSQRLHYMGEVLQQLTISSPIDSSVSLKIYQLVAFVYFQFYLLLSNTKITISKIIKALQEYKTFKMDIFGKLL